MEMRNIAQAGFNEMGIPIQSVASSIHENVSKLMASKYNPGEITQKIRLGGIQNKDGSWNTGNMFYCKKYNIDYTNLESIIYSLEYNSDPMDDANSLLQYGGIIKKKHKNNKKQNKKLEKKTNHPIQNKTQKSKNDKKQNKTQKSKQNKQTRKAAENSPSQSNKSSKKNKKTRKAAENSPSQSNKSSKKNKTQKSKDTEIQPNKQSIDVYIEPNNISEAHFIPAEYNSDYSKQIKKKMGFHRVNLYDTTLPHIFQIGKLKSIYNRKINKEYKKFIKYIYDKLTEDIDNRNKISNLLSKFVKSTTRKYNILTFSVLPLNTTKDFSYFMPL